MSSTIQVQFKIVLSLIAVILGSVNLRAESSDPQSSAWSDQQYVIRGYRKQTMVNSKRVEIKAKGAKGFSSSDLENLERIELSVISGELELKATAPKAFLENEELLFQGPVKVSFSKLAGPQKGGKKAIPLFELETKGPDERLHLTLSDMSMRSPSARIRVGDRHYSEESVHISLIDRKIFWSRAPRINGEVPKPGPLEIKF